MIPLYHDLPERLRSGHDRTADLWVLGARCDASIPGWRHEVIVLDIPVTVPGGGFGMGFFYDRTAGRLEGMPILGLDGDSVTLASRRFSDLVVLEFPGLGTATLSEPVADLGFRPGHGRVEGPPLKLAVLVLSGAAAIGLIVKTLID